MSTLLPTKTQAIDRLRARHGTVRVTPDNRDDLAEILVETDGVVTNHNFPCPICKYNRAVLNTTSGEFHPCWNCHRKNWRTVQIKSRFVRWLLKL